MTTPLRARDFGKDTEVEEAQIKLLAAALEQPQPTVALRRAANLLLDLVGHPLRVVR